MLPAFSDLQSDFDNNTIKIQFKILGYPVYMMEPYIINGFSYYRIRLSTMSGGNSYQEHALCVQKVNKRLFSASFCLFTLYNFEPPYIFGFVLYYWKTMIFQKMYTFIHFKYMLVEIY